MNRRGFIGKRAFLEPVSVLKITLMKPIILSVLLLGTCLLAFANPVVPTGLESRPLANKMGLVLNEYGLIWEEGPFTSWHVLVASSEARLAAGVGDLWDSGPRQGMEAGGMVRYRGQALSAGMSAWWKVRVFDAKEQASSWSQPSVLKVSSAAANERRVRRGGGSQGKLDSRADLGCLTES